MTQQELDRLVASALGEDLRLVRRRGFSVAAPLDVCFDPEPDRRPPLVVDWDEVDRRRHERNGVALLG